MISILGRAFVLIALAASCFGAVSGISSGVKKSKTGWIWSRRMSYISFFAMSIAIVLMEYALLTHDFSVSYVAEVGSTSTPTWVTKALPKMEITSPPLFYINLLGLHLLQVLCTHLNA